MARRSCSYSKTGGVENPGFNKWISAGSKQVRFRKVRGGVEFDMRNKPAKRNPKKKRAAKKRNASKRKVEKRVSKALKRYLSSRR